MKKKPITFFEDEDFESWSYKNNDLLWIHLVDRGICIDFTKEDFVNFYRRIKKTGECMEKEGMFKK